MFAEVIPLLRMPPQAPKAFDYEISLETGSINEGALVLIPWRKNKIFGIVAKLKKETEIKNKKISKIEKVFFSGNAFVGKDIIAVWFYLSSMFNMSVATLAKITVLPLQKTKINKIKLKKINPALQTSQFEKKYFNYSSEEQHKKIINNVISKGQNLIITPTVALATHIAKLFPKLEIFHSGLSQKKQFEFWVNVRNGKIKNVVGTKSALLLPFTKLNSIILDEEGNENHKSWDQAPRYNAKDVALIRATEARAKFYLLGFVPSMYSYKQMADGSLQKSKEGKIVSGERLIIIDKDTEWKKGNRDFISLQGQDLINTAEGIVFVYVNRKGFARFVECKDCGYIFNCSNCNLPYATTDDLKKLTCYRCNIKTSTPANCPSCGGVTIKGTGFGTERVAKEFKNYIEQNNIDANIIEINSEKPTQEEDKNIANNKLTIIVGTEYAKYRLDWQAVQGVIIPNADLNLQTQSWKAGEALYYDIMEYLFKTRANNAKVIVETRLPEHKIFSAIKTGKPGMFYDEELKWRKLLGWPPEKIIVQIIQRVDEQKTGRILRFEPKNVQYMLAEAIRRYCKSDEIIDIDPIIVQ